MSEEHTSGMEIEGDARTGNWKPPLALDNVLLFASISSDHWIPLTWWSAYGNYMSLVNNLKEPDDCFVIRRLISQMMATGLLSGARFDDEETRIRYSQKDTSDRTMPDHAGPCENIA